MVTRGAGPPAPSMATGFQVTAHPGENSPDLRREHSDHVCQVHFADLRPSYRLRLRAAPQSGSPRDSMADANGAWENGGHRLQWAKSLFLKNKTKTLSYGIILDLPSCKENPEFSCTLDPASPHVNVIRDHWPYGVGLCVFAHADCTRTRERTRTCTLRERGRSVISWSFGSSSHASAPGHRMDAGHGESGHGAALKLKF